MRPGLSGPNGPLNVLGAGQNGFVWRDKSRVLKVTRPMPPNGPRCKRRSVLRELRRKDSGRRASIDPS